jgi:hypothetical protein
MPLNLPFEAKALLNNIYRFSFYLKENTMLHHYKDKLVFFEEIIAIYSENHTNQISSLHNV